MIGNDQDLAVTRERVAQMKRLLEDLRKTARPEEWPALSSGYRLEIERMQGEILDYLVEGAARRPTGAPALCTGDSWAGTGARPGNEAAVPASRITSPRRPVRRRLTRPH